MVLSRLDYFRSRFFWQGDSEKNKYRLTRWNIICRPKDQGGLGVQDLLIKNSALLGKWLFRLLTENVARSLAKKIRGLKSIVPRLLETRGLTLLGGSNGEKERLLSL